LSFPRYGHPALAWLALTPLLVAVATLPDSSAETGGRRRIAPGRAFLLGLASGAVYFGGTVYWTGGVMAQYGGLSLAVSTAVASLLVAYLSLFPAIFALVVRRFVVAFGAAGLLLAPFVWVTTEWLGRTVLFGGFPWALVGYSQTRVLPIAQLASVTGVYGLSALVVSVNAALAMWLVARSPRRRLAPLAAVAVVLAVAAWGHLRIRDGAMTQDGRPVTVGLVQGNVSQDQKWDEAFADEIFARYIRQSQEAVRRGARLVIWPETATPFYFQEAPQSALMRQLAREHRIDMLFGTDEIDRRPPGRLYNSAFLLRRDGTDGGVYRKVHLVPFGEYVPFQPLLSFATPLVQAVSDFAPGAAPVPLRTDAGVVTTAICYEVVYPQLIREGVLRGSELLTTITNDAWFGRSSAPYQHFEMAAMRAIEQGRYLVRAANTGISGIVDPYGRILQASALFEEAVIVGEVRMRSSLTPYGRHGDIIAWTSTLLTGLAMVATFGRKPVRSSL
jgi:apolipoprotein N-acyltransferase